jgi:hypothetical protein
MKKISTIIAGEKIIASGRGDLAQAAVAEGGRA